MKDLIAGFQKVLSWLSLLEKSLGKSFGASILKKVISKVKKIIKVLEDSLKLIEECKAFALAAIPIYLLNLAVATTIAALIIGAGALGGAFICKHKVCAAIGGFLAAGPAIDAFSSIMESAYEDLAESCRGFPI